VSVLDEDGVFRASNYGKDGGKEVYGYVFAVANRSASLERLKAQTPRCIDFWRKGARTSVACKGVAAQVSDVRLAKATRIVIYEKQNAPKWCVFCMG
jgi:hypothetical protein